MPNFGIYVTWYSINAEATCFRENLFTHQGKSNSFFFERIGMTSFHVSDLLQVAKPPNDYNLKNQISNKERNTTCENYFHFCSH